MEIRNRRLIESKDENGSEQIKFMYNLDLPPGARGGPQLGGLRVVAGPLGTVHASLFGPGGG